MFLLASIFTSIFVYSVVSSASRPVDMETTSVSSYIMVPSTLGISGDPPSFECFTETSVVLSAGLLCTFSRGGASRIPSLWGTGQVTVFASFVLSQWTFKMSSSDPESSSPIVTVGSSVRVSMSRLPVGFLSLGPPRTMERGVVGGRDIGTTGFFVFGVLLG